MVDRAAHTIVASLRSGVPPEYGVERYSVGREDVLAVFRSDLDVVANGASALRYISADIGQGKTHLLRLLRHEAFTRDFVVAEVELSSGRCPLYSLLDVYRNIMLALRTASSPEEPALETVMDRWLDHQKSADHKARERSLDRLAPDFQAALLSYMQATNFLRPSPERRDAVLRWLVGESLPRNQRDPLELFENISDSSALAILDDVSDLFQDIGYGGICVLFDEAEALVSFQRSSERELAVRNLKRFVSAADDYTGCYFVYATTPSFVDSYGSSPEFHARSGDGTVLQLAELSGPDVVELAARVMTIYHDAYGWSPPDSVAATISDTLGERHSQRVADLTRLAIAALDEARLAAP